MEGWIKSTLVDDVAFYAGIVSLDMHGMDVFVVSIISYSCLTITMDRYTAKCLFKQGGKSQRKIQLMDD
jgi:hypothetical protein